VVGRPREHQPEAAGISDEMTRDGPSHLVLDLSRVTFFGAAGVRVLLDLREAQAAIVERCAWWRPIWAFLLAL